MPGRMHEKLKAERIQSKLGAPRLAELLAGVPGWELGPEGESLRRIYRFPTARSAALFVQLAAELGEAANLRPEVVLRAGDVTLTLGGAGGDGVAEAHFRLARGLDGRA